jgi:hypothetical protein
MFTNTPDNHFVIDVHPEYPQVSFASPCSVTASSSPASSGEIMADLAENGLTRHDISLFRLDRLVRDTTPGRQPRTRSTTRRRTGIGAPERATALLPTRGGRKDVLVTDARTIRGTLEDERRRQLVYGGELLIFEDVEPMAKFCAFADVLIREHWTRKIPSGPSSRWKRTTTL